MESGGVSDRRAGRVRSTAANAIERRLPSRSSAASHDELTIFLRRIVLLGASIMGLLLLGMVGLALSEGVGLWYAFRWSLDTAATVGGFPQPRTTEGQIIHVGLIVVGVGTLFYALATVAELFVAGHLGEVLAARRSQKMIDSLTDHHIVCGFGRVGRQVVRDLNAGRARYVVVDSNPESRDRAETLGVRLIEGDATDDAVLEQAGIQRARSIIACADSDADNVFITLTARELRGDIAIVAQSRQRGDREEAQARRRGPRHLALQVERHRDGAPGPASRSSAASSTSTSNTGWRRSWSASPARRSTTPSATSAAAR